MRSPRSAPLRPVQPIAYWQTLEDAAHVLGSPIGKVLELIHRGPLKASWVGGELQVRSDELAKVAR